MGTSAPPTEVDGLTMKLPTMLEWMVQKYVYVPERPLVLMTMLVGVLGVNWLEQVSPVEQEPVNLAPSLSTSKANWWRVSPLDRVIVTISPWLTVMVGLGVLVKFQALTTPVRVIVRLMAATLGIGNWFGSSRMTAV